MENRTLVGGTGRRGIALAAAVLTLGLSAGVATSTVLATAAEDAATAELELRTERVRTAVETTFGRYATTLHDLTTAAVTTPGLTSALVTDRLPGAQRVLVLDTAHRVLAAHSDEVAPPPPPVIVPTPVLARALELSRATGRVVATPAHVLMPDMTLPPAHRPAGFELAAPISTGTFHGWVVVAVRADELLDAFGVAGVTTTLTETAPSGETRAITTWPTSIESSGASPTRTVDVAFAGHAWQVVVSPSTPLVGAAREAAAPLAMTGLALLGLLLAVIVLIADSGRARALTVARRAIEQQAYELDRARRAEQARRDQEAELAGFTAAAGEHLNAPLHTIAGYADLLLSDDAPDTRRYAERIARSTGRIIGVVGQLTEFATSGFGDAALTVGPVDLESLTVTAVASELDSYAGERPSIDVSDLPMITADADLTRRVVGHLVRNALTYARPGTAPRVTIGARDLGDGRWRVEVADRGIGVPDEHRDRIFAPFHRAPAAEGYPGTGLGLAVCKRIVTRQGATIGVEPNPRGGSVFWFTVAASVPAGVPVLH